jgi:phosphoglycolate phosphatase
VRCGSKERHRLLALALERMPIASTGFPVFHFAPERGIQELLIARFGDQYRPADFTPELYSWSAVRVEPVDLTQPEPFAPNSVGGYVHSHVFEHLPAPLGPIITEMNAALVPGGFHMFQVPIRAGLTEEDLSPDLSEAERLRRFGQEDHMRYFGDADLQETLLGYFSDMTMIDVSSFIDADAARAAVVPPGSLTRHTGHSVYLFRKP